MKCDCGATLQEDGSLGWRRLSKRFVCWSCKSVHVRLLSDVEVARRAAAVRDAKAARRAQREEWDRDAEQWERDNV